MHFFESLYFYACLVLVLNAAVFSQLSYRNPVDKPGNEYDNYMDVFLVGSSSWYGMLCKLSAGFTGVISFFFVPILVGLYDGFWIGLLTFFVWFIGTFIVGNIIYGLRLLPVAYRLTPFTTIVGIYLFIKG